MEKENFEQAQRPHSTIFFFLPIEAVAEAAAAAWEVRKNESEVLDTHFEHSGGWPANTSHVCPAT